MMILCSVCKSDNLKEVEISLRGDFTIVEKTNKIKILPKSSKILKMLCLECGYINLYADDFQKFR